MTLVQFFYDKGSSDVFAYFPLEFWVSNTPTCYAINEGHGPCCPDYVKDVCKPVKQRAKWQPLFDHLKNVVGYTDLVRIPQPKKA